jgi:DNA invertase Pin-like site-specific DNA recombinase
METGGRSEAIRAGQARARAAGKRCGRPRAVFEQSEVVRLRKQEYSWREIAAKVGIGSGTARRAYCAAANSPGVLPEPRAACPARRAPESY